MEDWKELDVGNLPSDILTGNYEFKMSALNDWCSHRGDLLNLLGLMLYSTGKFSYRKVSIELIPSHEKIMSKEWFINNAWEKVIRYDHYYTENKRNHYLIRGSLSLWSSQFVGLDSRDIPPEAKTQNERKT